MHVKNQSPPQTPPHSASITDHPREPSTATMRIIAVSSLAIAVGPCGAFAPSARLVPKLAPSPTTSLRMADGEDEEPVLNKWSR